MTFILGQDSQITHTQTHTHAPSNEEKVIGVQLSVQYAMMLAFRVAGLIMSVINYVLLWLCSLGMCVCVLQCVCTSLGVLLMLQTAAWTYTGNLLI